MSLSDILVPRLREVHAAVDSAAFGKVVNPVITEIIYPIIYVVFGLAVLVFAYGIIEMIIKGNDPGARKTGQTHMLFGAIGMFIMVSAWGLIYLVSDTLKGVNSAATGNSNNQIMQSSLFVPGSSSSRTGSTNQSANQNSAPGFSGPAASPASQNSGSSPQSRVPIQADAGDLSQYYQNMNNGVFTENHDQMLARAIDLVTKKDIFVGQNSTVQFNSVGGVPTLIYVDGKNIPIYQNDYTQTELTRIQVWSGKSQ